ncbi:MAG: homoserine kinase [Promicromonosporaceae bacterium]|nr:homoserine kinase [Promicromonosporaceae bacterium]
MSLSVHVRVPATSGNLGPGFDTLGMAYGLHDDVTATLSGAGTEISVSGEGEADIARDDTNLVVRALRHTWDLLGVPQRGIKLESKNRIPHGRGLGSSAAAVVAGILSAAALAEVAFPTERALEVATEFEGHPDNVAPALYGGAVLTWVESGHPTAVKLALNPEISPTLLVPTTILATKTARAILPSHVPHVDAAFNLSRAALLTVALTTTPESLFPATADRLHQQYRASAMADSAEMVNALRELEVPAVISGAGPTVLVLGTRDFDQKITACVASSAVKWRVLRPGVDNQGAIVAQSFPKA